MIISIHDLWWENKEQTPCGGQHPTRAEQGGCCYRELTSWMGYPLPGSKAYKRWRRSSQDLRRSRRWEKGLRLKLLPVCIYVAAMLLLFCSTNWGYSKPRPGSGTTCAFSHVEWGKTHVADPSVHPGQALGPPPLPRVMNSFATNLCNAIQMTTITA